MKRGNFTNGDSSAKLDALMIRLQSAIKNGESAEAAALQTQIDELRTETADAKATGQNARQMVLSRDTRLTSLEDVATKFDTVIRAAETTHDNLRAEIANIELTPGPPGKDGADGQPGRNGLDGARGAEGKPGDKGDTGQRGTDGTPADMARVTALETKVRDLEAAKVFAVGIAATPGLALLQTQDVTIELSRAMPDTNYTLDLSRSQGLLTAGAVTFKTKTTNTVTYTLRAVVALGAGSLIVLARY